MKWLAQGHAGVHGRNEDTNNTAMFKLSPEESAELCLLCEGGFECSDSAIKEIRELYSRNQIFEKLFASALMLTSPDPPHPETLVTG